MCQGLEKGECINLVLEEHPGRQVPFPHFPAENLRLRGERAVLGIDHKLVSGRVRIRFHCMMDREPRGGKWRRDVRLRRDICHLLIP